MDVVQITGDGDTTTPAAAERLLDTGWLYDPDQFTCNAYLATGERPALVESELDVTEHMPSRNP